MFIKSHLTKTKRLFVLLAFIAFLNSYSQETILIKHKLKPKLTYSEKEVKWNNYGIKVIVKEPLDTISTYRYNDFSIAFKKSPEQQIATIIYYSPHFEIKKKNPLTTQIKRENNRTSINLGKVSLIYKVNVLEKKKFIETALKMIHKKRQAFLLWEYYFENDKIEELKQAIGSSFGSIKEVQDDLIDKSFKIQTNDLTMKDRLKELRRSIDGKSLFALRFEEENLEDLEKHIMDFEAEIENLELIVDSLYD